MQAEGISKEIVKQHKQSHQIGKRGNSKQEFEL